MIIQPKDGFDDLDITSRQQTWIVLLSTEADDECATLTSTPAHTWSAYLCYLCVLPILCRGACQRFDKARQPSALFANQDSASSTPWQMALLCKNNQWNSWSCIWWSFEVHTDQSARMAVHPSNWFTAWSVLHGWVPCDLNEDGLIETSGRKENGCYAPGKQYLGTPPDKPKTSFTGLAITSSLAEVRFG